MIVTLGQLWLHDAAELSDSIAVEVHEITHAPAVNVRTDPYAGGNFRAVVVAGVQANTAVTLSFLTDEQQAWLRAHIGVLVCYRDPRGEKFYGLYTGDGFKPRQMPNSWSVGLSVAEVTVDEAVAS